jgi:peptidoglycan/xylan/chitin deacetylase (PgdA/CDA1 family)
MRRLKLGILYTARLLGLFHLSMRLQRDRLCILAYHGFELMDETSFRPKLFIRGTTFEQRLASLRRYGFDVIDLDDAVDKLYANRLPRHSIVLTVDDGFHSFYRVAVPALEEAGYTATVYVTTYYVENPIPIFRLAVQYMFWATAKKRIELRGLSWSADRTIDVADRAAVDKLMWDCIQHGEALDGEDARTSLAEHMGELLGISYKDIAGKRIVNLMTPEEVRALESMNVRVELHTHRHRFPLDDRSEVEREIAQNRAALGRYVEGDRNHFCYPSGIWAEHQAEWLESMGIKSATTCLPGMNDSRTPRHALRRFLDGENIHQLEFEAAVTGFSSFLSSLKNLVRKSPA